MRENKIKILLTGGGSGGHIYPLIAVAEELKKLARDGEINLELWYIGCSGSYRRILQEGGIKVSDIVGSKIRRYFSGKNILEAPKFLIGFMQAFWKIFFSRPDAVFSKGGPGALPVVFASWIFKIPIVIHESDSVPGMTNAVTARLAGKVAVSFASAERYFPGKAVLTGNPIRRDLLEKSGHISQEKAKRHFGFDPSIPLLFFVGGSQGAIRLNSFVSNNLEELTGEWQVLHQVGRVNYNGMGGKEAVRNFTRYKPVAYLNADMATALSAADLVVTRAGAGSIFEIAAFGKPSILVPLPEAAQNHQLRNAEEYAKSGAAFVLEEKEMDIKKFVILAHDALCDNEKKSMSEAAKAFSKPDAARAAAEIVYSLVL